MKKFIYYLPRLLSVVLVIFFALFIAEGFSLDFSWVDSLYHLILTLVVVAIAIIAWKKPNIGGWIFVVLGIFFMIFFSNPISNGLIIGSVPLVIGILFLIEAYKKQRTNIK